MRQQGLRGIRRGKQFVTTPPDDAASRQPDHVKRDFTADARTSSGSSTSRMFRRGRAWCSPRSLPTCSPAQSWAGGPWTGSPPHCHWTRSGYVIPRARTSPELSNTRTQGRNTPRFATPSGSKTGAIASIGTVGDLRLSVCFCSQGWGRPVRSVLTLAYDWQGGLALICRASGRACSSRCRRIGRDLRGTWSSLDNASHASPVHPADDSVTTTLTGEGDNRTGTARARPFRARRDRRRYSQAHPRRCGDGLCRRDFRHPDGLDRRGRVPAAAGMAVLIREGHRFGDRGYRFLRSRIDLVHSPPRAQGDRGLTP
jgi:hypothetical protein